MTVPRMVDAGAEALAEREAIAAEPGLWDILHDVFLRHPSTLIALVVVVLFIVIAVFAPWIAPDDPLRQSFLWQRSQTGETSAQKSA